VSEPPRVRVCVVPDLDRDSEDNLLVRVLQHDGYLWGVRVTVEKPAETNLTLTKGVLNHELAPLTRSRRHNSRQSLLAGLVTAPMCTGMWADLAAGSPRCESSSVNSPSRDHRDTTANRRAAT